MCSQGVSNTMNSTSIALKTCITTKFQFALTHPLARVLARIPSSTVARNTESGSITLPPLTVSHYRMVSRIPSVVLVAVAGTHYLREVTSWGAGTVAWGGTRRWAPTVGAWGRARTKAVTFSRPKYSLKNKDVGAAEGLRSSLEDSDVDIVEGLGEGEELLGTVDVSPEEIAEFFAKPT